MGADGRPEAEASPTAYEAYAERAEAEETRLRRARRWWLQRAMDKPKISLLMPVYDPEPAHLEAVLQSILRQTYGVWQLCLVDDRSTDPRIGALLRAFAERDRRIQVAFRPRNGHICAASNDALKMCSGAWVGLVDHDDLLHPDALFWVFLSIQNHPHGRIFFTDEDKIDRQGRRFEPNFKFDLDLELLRNQNFTSHFSVYCARLIAQVGGFRLGFEGSQDYDLVLRAIDASSVEQVVHIPRILYHWRMTDKSTASFQDYKPYTFDAAKRALDEHFRRNQEPACAESSRVPGLHRLRSQAAFGWRDTAILLHSLAGREGPCERFVALFRAIAAHAGRVEVLAAQAELEQLLGRDGPRWVRQLGERLAFYPSGSGPLCQGINTRVSALGTPFVVLVSADLVPEPACCWTRRPLAVQNRHSWLVEMLEQLARPAVGVVGARILDEHGEVESVGLEVTERFGMRGIGRGFPVSDPGYSGRLAAVRQVSAVALACMAARREVLVEAGLFDETLPPQLAATAACMRVREQGHKVLVSPYATVRFRHGNATSSVLPRAQMAELWARYPSFPRTDRFAPSVYTM